MPKFNVIITRSFTIYERKLVEVEAETSDDALNSVDERLDVLKYEDDWEEYDNDIPENYELSLDVEESANA